MKKLLFAFIFFLSGIAVTAQTGDSTQIYVAPSPEAAPAPLKKPMPRTVLRANFFGLFGGNFHGEIEQVISKKFSAQLGIGYRYINLDPILSLDSTVAYDSDRFTYIQSGITVIPQFKFYWTSFSKTLIVPTGSYVAPFARIGIYDIDFTDKLNQFDLDFTIKKTTISGGFVFGFQLLAGRVFALDGFLGPQFKYTKFHDIKYKNPGNNKTNPLDFKEETSFDPGIRFGISMGIGIPRH